MFCNSPRLTGRGAGLAVVLKKHLSFNLASVEKPPSFEVLMFKVNCDTPVCCIVIYCPPKPKSSFLSDFTSSVALSYDKILLVGDFNIDVDGPTCST